VISKEDYEAMVKCGDPETKQPKDGVEDEDATANPDGDSKKVETAIMKQNLAEIGGPRKRKQAKVVGDEVEGDKVEGADREEVPPKELGLRNPKQKKNNKKKIKLSFEE
jgi:hypothetical protein